MRSEAYLPKLTQYLSQLCAIPSPSGFTQKVQSHLMEWFSRLGFQPYETRKGTVIVPLNPHDSTGSDASACILSAHIDTLGAMVRSVKDNGRLRITPIGGYPISYIVTENVKVHTFSGEIFSGTVQQCRASSHVYEDVNKVEKTEEQIEIVLDEIVSKKDETKALGIEAGNFVSFDPRTIFTTNGFVKSRHLDDKASAAVLMTFASMVKQEPLLLNRKVYLCFTNYEEVGHGASAGLPEDISEMLAVDMGVVGDDLETNEYKVSICAKDSGGPYDYRMTQELVRLAKKGGLQYAVDIYPRYGSDAGAALRSGKDIRFALIGPGVSASHGYERTHLHGLTHTLELILLYCVEDQSVS